MISLFDMSVNCYFILFIFLNPNRKFDDARLMYGAKLSPSASQKSFNFVVIGSCNYPTIRFLWSVSLKGPLTVSRYLNYIWLPVHLLCLVFADHISVLQVFITDFF